MDQNRTLKRQASATDVQLGEGSVGKLMLRLAIPTIIAQMVNLLYNLVDRIYIGHIPETGDLALTGLGLCFPVIMLITACSNLIGMGGAPIVAMNMGRGRNDEAEEIVGNSTAVLILIALVITTALEVFAQPILILFGASSHTLPYALSYLRIYVGGTLFVMLTLGLNAFINTQGFSKVAMKTVLLGAVCNIILDPIFIFGLHMDVAGAALATVISQGISTVWVLRFLTGKSTKLRIQTKYLRLKSKVLLPVMALGVSPFIMNATESILNIAFNASLSRYGGDLAVSAMTILSSVMSLLYMPITGLSQGAQPILSYNYGAGKVDRVRKAYRQLSRISITYALLFFLAVQLFPHFFVYIFNNSSQELIRITVWAMRIYMAAAGLFGILMSVQQTFTALGQAKLSLIIACLRKVILLIPLIYILPHFFSDKVFAVFLAEPVADVLSVTTAGILFLLNIRKILAAAPKPNQSDSPAC